MAEENNKMSDFGLADCLTTNELIDTLLSRHDHAVIALYQTETPNGDNMDIEWQGDPVMCKGLTQEIVEHITEETYVPEFDELDDD